MPSSGPLAREALADRLLDRAVGLGHRRPVGLRLDEQVARAKAAERDRIGRIGERESEGEVGAHRAPTLSPRLVRGCDDVEDGSRQRQLLRRRPRHRLGRAGQSSVESADAVEPAAGLERQEGRRRLGRQRAGRLPRIRLLRPLDLVAVGTECGLPGDERRSEERGPCPAEATSRPFGDRPEANAVDPPATTGALCFPKAITRPLAHASWGSSASRYSTCVPCDTFSPLPWLCVSGELSVTWIPRRSRREPTRPFLQSRW